MKPNEKTALYAVLSDVMAYYRQDTSEFMLAVWWNACQTFDLEQVTTALTRHATDPERGQFAPKVADIVRILSGTPTDRAQLAWGKVLEAMQRVGAYTDVVFDDPAIHAAVEDLGGWPKLCRSKNDDLGYIQHRFCESHKAYVNKGAFAHPRILMGDRSPDSEYAKKGLPVPKPAVIGEVEAARLVYRQGQVGGKTAITTSIDQLAVIAIGVGGAA